METAMTRVAEMSVANDDRQDVAGIRSTEPEAVADSVALARQRAPAS